jgi:hypothetical protein
MKPLRVTPDQNPWPTVALGVHACCKARNVNQRLPKVVPVPAEEPTCVRAAGVFKKKGRWYASLGCPRCAAQLRVKLSLGPMVARCAECAIDVEADVRRVVKAGRA